MDAQRRRWSGIYKIGLTFITTVLVATTILLAHADRVFAVVVSNSDLFEAATITGSSGSFFASEPSLFDGTLAQMIFDDDFEGIKFVNFDTTGGADTVASFHISFQSDGNQIDRRAASFSLLADTNGDSTYETLLFTGPVVYTLPTDPDPLVADITVVLPVPVTADLFRLEVTPTYASAFPGPRVIELDAFPAVPEPATLLLVGSGFAALAAWRRLKI